MRLQALVFLVGIAIVVAQPPRTRTKKGQRPVRPLPPRRNDVKDVPDNSGGRAFPPPVGPVVRGPPPPRAPPQVAPVAAGPPPQMTRVRQGPPPPLYRPVPLQAASVPPNPIPQTRTKSAGFLGGPVPYVPPAEPFYAPTTMPPTVPTTAYISYDTPDVKKEEEEEG